MSGGSITSLGRDIQTEIGDRLRAVYEEIVEQGIPDRFAGLLSELDKIAKVVSGKQARHS